MAAGFKQATVNAASVPATQTSFPSYVDLSRLGITTLAEAQSVRVYADLAKTTEWARDIVTVAQMHVKVPSLTSTVTIYVDYDGVRADYVVTDTFGRNAVWSAYDGVFHMEDASGNITDSTGKTALTVTGSPTFAVAAKIVNGITYNGSSQYHSKSTGAANPTVPVSIQAWFTATDVTAGPDSIAYMGVSGSEHGLLVNSSQLWALSQDSGNAQAVSGTISSGTRYMGHGVFSSSTLRTVYLNGASVGTNTTSKNPSSGAGLDIGSRFSTVGQDFQGTIDEVRFIKSALSANWIITEYNNQNAEATFWGTWSTVGGANTTNFFYMD